MVLRIPAILIALTVHEYAHGYVAWRKGDNTAEKAGRLSFNPLSHLDVLGSLMLMFGPFGWAKPVPVNPLNLANPRRDMVWVAAAGPLSNIVLALIAGFTMKSLLGLGDAIEVTSSMQYLFGFFYIFIQINLGLALFNLFPIPPLDGYNITVGLLPVHKVNGYINAMRHAPKILLFLIIGEWLFKIPLFSAIINPIWQPWFYFWNKLVIGL